MPLSLDSETEALLRDIADQEGRDVHELFADVVHAGLKVLLKRAFDRELKDRQESARAGNVVTERESLAGLGLEPDE